MLDIFRTILEGMGCVALFFIGFVLNDLKQRIVRIENKIFFDGYTQGRKEAS